jgi:hypothetical protein
MTRPLTLTGAGGRLSYQYGEDGTVRDIYWPFVGQANQITRLPQRLAVRVDDTTSWLDEPDWTRQLDYDDDTIVGRSVYENSALCLRVTVRDAVDPRDPVYVRRIDIEDLSRKSRPVDIFASHHFEMPGNETGDTSLYDPDAKAILSFKNDIYVFTGTEPSFGEAYDALPSDVHWRYPPPDIFANVDRGALSRSAVAHNKVNSVVGLAVLPPANGLATVYTWDAWGRSEEEARAVHDRVGPTGPQAFSIRPPIIGVGGYGRVKSGSSSSSSSIWRCCCHRTCGRGTGDRCCKSWPNRWPAERSSPAPTATSG